VIKPTMYSGKAAWTPAILRKAAKAIEEASDEVLKRWTNNFFGTVSYDGIDRDP